jgi:DnaJ like chaperone protein
MGIVAALALLGALFGGFRGMVMGALFGLGVRFVLDHVARSGLRQAQAGFLDASFAVMGALSKADGVVTRDEIESANRVFDMLRLGEPQRQQARAAFNRGKAPDFNLDAEIDRIRGAISYGRGPLLRLFLQLQCMAVAADGRVHAAEHAMLVRIAQRLGLSERDLAQLEALLRAGGGRAWAGAGGWAGGRASSREGDWAGGWSGPGGGARPAPPASRLDDAYTALGVTRDTTDEVVKRTYRRLVSQNHPDKLNTRSLPDSVRQLAEERIREINVAYELIKESRGFK